MLMASMTEPRFSFTFTGGLLKLPSIPGMSPEWYATCHTQQLCSGMVDHSELHTEVSDEYSSAGGTGQGEGGPRGRNGGETLDWVNFRPCAVDTTTARSSLEITFRSLSLISAASATPADMCVDFRVKVVHTLKQNLTAIVTLLCCCRKQSHSLQDGDLIPPFRVSKDYQIPLKAALLKVYIARRMK